MFTFLEISDERLKNYDNKITLIRFLENFVQTLIILTILRELSPEIKFFQYQISFYYLAFLFYWGVITLLSIFTQNISYIFDLNNYYGIKAKEKYFTFFLIKQLLFLVLVLIFFITNFIFPLLIESFNFSIQKNLENFWVFDQLLKIQLSFLVFFLLLPEGFRFFFFKLTNEKTVNLSLKFWKIFLIFSLIISAIFTPTLDNSIQIIFSSLFFFFYFCFLTYVKKRLLTNSLGFLFSF